MAQPVVIDADILIAATAIEGETKMVSKNQKQYQFLPGLDLLQYPFGQG